MAGEVNVLTPGQFSAHRTLTGAPVVPDAAMSASFPARAACLNTRGYLSVVFATVLAGGAGPTVTLEFYLYDPAADTFYLFATEAGVTSGAVYVKDTQGLRLFVRVAVVAGNPTGVSVRVAPGEPLNV